jgi:hypothetical protein
MSFDSFYSFLATQLSLFLKSFLEVWGYVWWIVLLLSSIIILWEFWLIYSSTKWFRKIKWTILEIKVPKNVLKTPKAMEQVFAAAHASHSPATFYEHYFKGERDYSMSFEIVGHSGEAHFYIRLPSKFRNLMESAIYSQYPEAEISEVENYLLQMPRIIPNDELDFFGGEWILASPNYYPILTYPVFEEMLQEQRIDTMALILEAISKLKGDEQIWLQFIIRPIGHQWAKEGEEAINKLLGVKNQKKKSLLSDFPGIGFTLGELLFAPFEHPSQEVKKPASETNNSVSLNPSLTDVIKMIRQKISKTSFQTTVRFLCIDTKENFNGDNVASVVGYLKQFGTQTMNAFRPDPRTWPKVYSPFFKKRRTKWKKRMIYERYRDMMFTPFKNQSILNTEELATVYHFPIFSTQTTELEKITSRKGSPPANVPIIDED